MMTEDYVSFETAKLLKEKGYDWEESPFYSEQDKDEWRYNNSYEIPNPTYNKDIPFDSETQTMVAPHISIQLAMKWLREVHNLFVEIHYATALILQPHTTIYFEIFYMSLDYTTSGKNMLPDDYIIEYYTSYEEACEAAIKYCLENLI